MSFRAVKTLSTDKHIRYCDPPRQISDLSWHFLVIVARSSFTCVVRWLPATCPWLFYFVSCCTILHIVYKFSSPLWSFSGLDFLLFSSFLLFFWHLIRLLSFSCRSLLLSNLIHIAGYDRQILRIFCSVAALVQLVDGGGKKAGTTSSRYSRESSMSCDCSSMMTWNRWQENTIKSSTCWKTRLQRWKEILMLTAWLM